MNSGASRALLPPGHGFGLGFAVRKNLGVAAVPGSMCGGQMRIIAFITHSADIRQILDHIGVESEPPHIPPARGPPLAVISQALWGGLRVQQTQIHLSTSGLAFIDPAL